MCVRTCCLTHFRQHLFLNKSQACCLLGQLIILGDVDSRRQFSEWNCAIICNIANLWCGYKYGKNWIFSYRRDAGFGKTMFFMLII